MGSDTNVDRAIYDLLLKQCPAMWLGIPIGIGDVYWVDSVNGNDANAGTTPTTALATITHALVHCQNDHNDYIMVIAAAPEAAIINISKRRVHIIGVGNLLPRPNQTNPPVTLAAGGATGVLQVSTASNYCEIAGFMIGGAANCAGIENNAGTPIGLHIHDCVFGHTISGGAPRDGILIALNAVNIRIENNIFLGTPGGKGLLTRDGIRWASAADPLNGNIENNQFKALPGLAINFVSVLNATGGITIKDNLIVCEGDTQGSAITLAATTRGFMVVGNKALYGPSTPGMANNPYLDNTVVAPFNTWMGNYKGNTLIDPA